VKQKITLETNKKGENTVDYPSGLLAVSSHLLKLHTADLAAGIALPQNRQSISPIPLRSILTMATSTAASAAHAIAAAATQQEITDNSNDNKHGWNNEERS
jgi:hypothetical protein